MLLVPGRALRPMSAIAKTLIPIIRPIRHETLHSLQTLVETLIAAPQARTWKTRRPRNVLPRLRLRRAVAIRLALYQQRRNNVDHANREETGEQERDHHDDAYPGNGEVEL